jgi:excisionase family DNA binding protein
MAKRKKEPDETITVAEAAKRLKIGINQAYAAAHRKEFPVIKVGSRYLIPLTAFERMLRGETPITSQR